MPKLKELKTPEKITIDEGEVPRPILAEAILRLSKAAQELSRSSGLNQRGILTLLHQSSKLPRRDIERVLRAMRELERDYCVPAPRKL